MRFNGTNRLARAPALRRPRRADDRQVEPLEGRRLLAAMFFDGGGGSNLWNNPDNWSLHRLPTAQDDVSIGSTFHVALSGQAATVRTLSLDGTASLSVGTGLTIGMSSYAFGGTAFNLQPGGTLDGPGQLTVHGDLNWTGGTMQGEGRTLLALGGRGNVSGPDAKALRRTLRVEEHLIVQDADLQLRDGTLELDPRAWMGLWRASILGDGGTNRFDNAGTINPSTARIDVPLYHSGFADVTELYLTGGGEASGRFEMSGLGILRVGGPGYTFGTGAPLFGWVGEVRFESGTSTVADAVQIPTLTVTGAVVTMNNNVDVSGVTLVEAPTGVLNLAGAVSNLKTIQVETASRINLVGNGANVLRTTYPGLQESTRLDVGREAVIFDYPPGYSSLDDVRSKIASGYANGAWTGPGICSELAGSTGRALGYGEASALFSEFPATFMGQAVDDTSILVRYTRAGDANLDGTVNLTDFNRLAGGFGATAAYWTQGEFNYDRSVNLSDFNLLATNFGQSTSTAADDADETEALRA